MINIKTFFKDKDLLFNNDKEGVLWVKRNLKPTQLIRIGKNYLVDRKEMEALLSYYIQKQKEIYNNRVIRAKALPKKKSSKIK
jgi:hypothetical protein